MNLRKLLFLCLHYLSENKIAADNKPVEETIIALERAAMDRWAKEIPMDSLSYLPMMFVHGSFLGTKLEGIDKLKELYETIRGKVEIDRYEFIRPVVQAAGGCAVLTYNFILLQGRGAQMELHGSLPFETSGKWKIIHTHWSLVKPLK